MNKSPFQFDLYRLNVVDDESMLDFMGKPLRDDDGIRELLKHATSPDLDQQSETETFTLKWSVREYVEFGDDSPPKVVGITLARSIIEQVGQTVTATGLEESVVETKPPLAKAIHLFFRMDRHLVAVEHDSVLLSTQAWRTALHRVFDAAAKSLQIRSSLRLEPVPQKEEILKAFRSFSKLTRLRLKLRIPNPDLSRWTQRLASEMTDGGIREYLQDMKNPNGLNQNENALPHASVSLAQAGYKDGEVIMEGLRENKKQKIKTGRKAARGRLEQIRDFVRGVNANAKSKEAKQVTEAIIAEIDQIAEPSMESGKQ